MRSSILFQQCPQCLVRRIWRVLVIVGWWLYSYCFVECCFQDLFHIARSIFVRFLSSFFSIHFVSVYVTHPYSRIETTDARKKLHFILSDKSDFYMIDNLSKAVHAFVCRIQMWFSVDKMLFPRHVNLSTDFSFWKCLLFD